MVFYTLSCYLKNRTIYSDSAGHCGQNLRVLKVRSNYDTSLWEGIYAYILKVSRRIYFYTLLYYYRYVTVSSIGLRLL